MKSLKLLATFALLLAAAPAYAHFIWINAAKGTDGKTTIQVCFGEEAAPGEADLVDKVSQTKLWVQETGKKPAEQKLEKKINDNVGYWGANVDPASKGLTATCTYGVLTRAEKTYLLQYAAKYLDSTEAGALKAYGRSENLKVDVVPTLTKSECEIEVLIDGKPVVADSQVMVSSPSHEEKELMTDAKGKVKFAITEGGQYEIRARVKEDKAGKLDGKEYPYVMHYTTLTLKVAKP